LVKRRYLESEEKREGKEQGKLEMWEFPYSDESGKTMRVELWAGIAEWVEISDMVGNDGKPCLRSMKPGKRAQHQKISSSMKPEPLTRCPTENVEVPR
jgi:hypothetical protein